MKKKIMIISIITTIILITIVSLYSVNRKYTYICFKEEFTGGNFVEEKHLTECTTNKKLEKGVITNKEELKSKNPKENYVLIDNITYKPKEFIYKKDFYITHYEKNTETEVPLLTELSVKTQKSSEDEMINYHIYIKNEKLYATNLNEKKDALIFDKEKVKNIAVRPICCAGEGLLIILTQKGNIYLSEHDVNYWFSFNFPFKKLNASNIDTLKLKPKKDLDIVKDLYGITLNGEKILLHTLN